MALDPVFATHPDPLWCHFCDRPESDCACHLDPNGPADLEAQLANAEQAHMAAGFLVEIKRDELKVALETQNVTRRKWLELLDKKEAGQ